MRCSKCSEVVKPVVAIDMDGTLGDYHGHFIRFAATYTGDEGAVYRCSLNMYDGSIRFGDYICEWFGITKNDYQKIKLAYRQGGMKRSMPPISGHKRICETVIERGAELWITTTRPYLSLDNIIPDTVAWFDRQGIGFDHMLFDADKYAVLANRVDSERVVAILDDLPEMIGAAAGVFGETVPILVKGKFNTAAEALHQGTLDEVRPIVSMRINHWKGIHNV